MASTQALKSRRNAVKNIGQITKAMEVVAATKMRTAQTIALASRPYALLALRILGRLSAETEKLPASPLLEKRAVKTTLVVLVSSDKGLAGSFNKEVFRAADRFFETDTYRESQEHAYRIMTVGKKAREYAAKHATENERAFTGFGDFVRAEETAPLAEEIIRGFSEGRWDRVVFISTHFLTALKQTPLVRTVLPVDFDEIRATVAAIVPEHGRYSGTGMAEEEAVRGGRFLEGADRSYLYEPGAEAVFSRLVPFLVRMQVHDYILEANASEHSARRVAMKTATDNARELEGDLTRQFNKARQEKITTELLDITGTQAALN